MVSFPCGLLAVFSLYIFPALTPTPAAFIDNDLIVPGENINALNLNSLFPETSEAETYLVRCRRRTKDIGFCVLLAVLVKKNKTAPQNFK